MKFRDDSLFDYKVFCRCALTIVLMIVAARISSGYALVILAFVAFSAIVQNKPDKTFFAILLIVMMTVGSSMLIPKSTLSFVVMRGTLMFAGFMLSMRVFGRSGSKLIAPFTGVMFYILYMAGVSVMGWNPMISELKIILFITVFFAFYSSAGYFLSDNRVGINQVRAIMFSVAGFFLIGSVLAIPFPAISMMNGEEVLRNPDLASLFCGVTNHSQCLGPCCAILGTIVLGDWVFGVGKKSPVHLVLMFTTPILIYKSASRTAMGSLLLGCMLVIFFFMRARGIQSRWRARVMNMFFMIGFLGALLIVALPGTRNSAIQFINKRSADNTQINVEEVIAARGGKVEECMDNFRKSPAFGNGFQVSEMMQEGGGAFASILSAPIEKGFIWAALLEEGGAIGFSIFVIFVLSTIFALIKRQAYIAASTFIVFLVTNTGEFSFFSLTYTGGLMWACVFMGAVLDGCRLNQKRQERMNWAMIRGGW